MIRVKWADEPIGTRRKTSPQDRGKNSPVYECPHRGPDRFRLRPRIQVYQPATAGRGRWYRSIRLPSIRSCCLPDREARRAWWNKVSPLLARWVKAGTTPKGDPFKAVDRRAVTRALAERIPRPATETRLRSWRTACASYRSRKRERRELQLQAELEVQRRTQPFLLLGLNIHATAYEIKQALRRKKLEILRDHGSLEDLRQVQSAAEAALAQRIACM